MHRSVPKSVRTLVGLSYGEVVREIANRPCPVVVAMITFMGI